MNKEKALPEGFRIQAYVIRGGDAMDPYDWGEWTNRLERWEKRTVGHLWWKREVLGWWVIEYNTSRDRLVQTAKLLEKSA